MKKGGTTSTRPLVKKTKGLFYFKDVRRVGQLQASMFLSNDEMHLKSVFRRFLVFVIFCGTIMGRLNE